MNTTTPLSLTAVASVLPLAATVAGCANGEQTSDVGKSRAHAVSQVVVTPAMHRALVRSAADRYVSELLVRARMAAQSPATTVDDDLSPLRGP